MRLTGISITEFGAVADGTTVNTAAIQKAIDTVAERGGGSVIVPPGRFVTGTIRLRSRVSLFLDPAGVLAGSPDINDYPLMDTMGNDNKPACRHLLLIRDCEQVWIGGGGTIDGNGPAFWKPQKAPGTWIGAKPDRVGRMVEWVRCTDCTMRDFTLANSPGWTCHVHECDRMIIDGVQIRNNLFGPNTDGFDITSSADVRVSNCHIVTGDDAIVLKAKHSTRCCERITVTNCTIQTNCVALKVGTETQCDVRQVTFSNCVVTRSTRAFGLYSLDGCVVEDVVVSNIACDTDAGCILNRPIHLDVRRRTDSSGFPTIRNVVISNFVARTDGRILMTAEDGCTLENIVLRDIIMHYPRVDDPAPSAPEARSAQFSNRSPEARGARGVVVADGIRNLVVDNLLVSWPGTGTDVPLHVVWGRNLTGGYVRCPVARPSQASLPKYLWTNCDIDVLEGDAVRAPAV